MSDQNDNQDQNTDEKSRTQEQFEKLTNSNKELKEEKEKLAKENEELRKNVLESLKPEPPQQEPQQMPQQIQQQAQNYQNLSPQQVQDEYDKLVDENNYVDINQFKSILRKKDEQIRQAIEEAKKARQEAAYATKRQNDFEESDEIRKLHRKYPELDPKNSGDKFNEEFYDAVRNELVGQMISSGKRDVMKAADKWANRFSNDKKDTETQKRKQEQERNAAQTPTGRSHGSASQADINDLIRRTRTGDRNALAERLQRSGY